MSSAELSMSIHWYGPYETGRGRHRRRHSSTVVLKCEELEVWNQHWTLDRAVQIGIRLERVIHPRRRRSRQALPRDTFEGRSDSGPWDHIFGISGRDKVVQVLRGRGYLGVESRGKIRWLVRRSHIHRFIASRKRDKFQVVDLGRSPKLRELVSDFDSSYEDGDLGIYFDWPEIAESPMAVYRCEGCGISGPRSEFHTRMLAGLASSVGIDCPRCKPRDIGAMGLAYGSPRGKVALADEQPCLVPRIGPLGPERYS